MTVITAKKDGVFRNSEQAPPRASYRTISNIFPHPSPWPCSGLFGVLLLS
jgi:hypothetical protein